MLTCKRFSLKVLTECQKFCGEHFVSYARVWVLSDPYFWNNSLCGISFLQNFKHSENFWKISCMRISNFCKYSLLSTTANNAKLYKVYLTYLIRTKRFIIIVHEDVFANFTDFYSHKSRKYLQYLQFYNMIHRSSYYHNN